MIIYGELAFVIIKQLFLLPGNDISALGSVPTAIYCFLRSLKPVDYIPVCSFDV